LIACLVARLKRKTSQLNAERTELVTEAIERRNEDGARKCDVTHADSGTSVHLFLLGLDFRSLRSFRRKAEPFTDRAELISDDRSGRRATNI
jgi:hypothetical protein